MMIMVPIFLQVFFIHIFECFYTVAVILSVYNGILKSWFYDQKTFDDFLI